jgi:hypothetical protein
MLGDREDSLNTNNLDVKKLYDKIDKLEKENEEFKEYKKNTENKIKELEKQLRILINKK